ncbi:unnamed protein product [Prorocentrum cordatum]|uniref:phosphatidylserine decarboxylase n=1 Tax=Prorocentrum cordatum TaxID=2364126 RepID=A0ABN9VLA6_9DINO|nr:unnamed protein product [Polarella glacialis]
MPAPIADESEGMADSFGVVLILTAALVCTFACTMQHKFQECVEIVGNPAQITSPGTLFWLRILSGRMRSRWFGALTEVWLPVGLRAPLFRLFAWTYGVHLEEVKHPLDSFRTLNDFFCRVLKDGARPISDIPAGLVSPVDGRVLAAGVIEHADARVEQVKGATYSVPAFLGLDPFECKAEKSVLRYVVLYLAPGDYHRIHAPCRATFSQGRHFCGELFPLKQCILKNVNDIFAVNEPIRVFAPCRFGLVAQFLLFPLICRHSPGARDRATGGRMPRGRRSGPRLDPPRAAPCTDVSPAGREFCLCCFGRLLCLLSARQKWVLKEGCCVISYSGPCVSHVRPVSEHVWHSLPGARVFLNTLCALLDCAPC